MIEPTLGADIRALRKSRRMTLAALAQAMGKSVGWLSQVERDISSPRMSDIQAMAQILDVPQSLFFGSAAAQAEEQGVIVRADARRKIGSEESGLIEALLSPDLTDDFEAIHSTFQPGASRGETRRRDTQELAYLVSGKLDIWIADRGFTVAEGDSFRIRGESFRWSNPYEFAACAIWIVAPPVY